ncbi:vWA domain-containing protein [Klebsiella sp. I138]|uniref:vWA domain-containing protein n=1 Tax=Klebsiella sp. I138 TaxID=2755385 RepID=UPI003DA8F3A5
MSNLHFIYPWRLSGLLIPVLLWLCPRTPDSAWRYIMDLPFAQALIVGYTSRRAQILPWLFALGVIALAGPAWEREFPTALAPESNVMVILQQDPAMYAQDLPPNRNERMQEKISELVARTPGTRYGLVVYSHQAFVTTPLTQDPQFFSLFLHAQTPSLMPQGTGSGLRQAVELALNNMPAAPRSLILVADTLSADDAAYLKKLDAPLQIWVPGTAAGGALATNDTAPGVDTRLNVTRFSHVRDTGIPLTLVTADQRDLKVIRNHIQHAIARQNSARSDLHWKNSGWVLIIPMLALLFFLRSQLIYTIVILPVLFWSPPGAAAWLDAWVSPDVQGQQAFEKGEYLQAAGHFHDPLWQGIAWYNAGNFPAATAAFRDAPQTAETLLWLGNALALQKKWPESLNSYDRALSKRPDWKLAQSNRQKIARIVMQLRQQAREQEPGADMPDSPDDIVKEMTKGEGEQQKDIGIVGNASPPLTAWFDHLSISPSGLLENLYRLGAQEQQP